MLCACILVLGACNRNKKEIANTSKTINNTPTKEVYEDQGNMYAVIIALEKGNTEEAKKQLEDFKFSEKFLYQDTVKTKN